MASFLSPARDVRVDDSSYWYSRLQASRPDLEVANEKLDGRGASALGNAISIDKHLRKITIGPNKISESGAMGLGDGIGRNEGSLTEFSVLDGNDIGPAGCKALITAVKRNRRIVSFSIFDKTIKEEGEIEIAKALKEMGRFCPHFEGFPLSKYRTSIFGLPATTNEQTSNAAILHLLRDSSATSGAFEAYRDAGPSRSDKYDEDDYDDINFKTVSIVDGSHSPLVLTHHAALSPPRGAAAERVQPRAPINAIRAFSAAHAEPSVTQSCSAQYGIPQYENQHALRDLPSASHQAALKLQASKSLEGKSKEKPHATLLAPPPPINLFTKSISAESAAVRSAAEGRIQKHGSS